jgi:hypothetical protein
MPTANAVFRIKSWDEKPYGDAPPKLTRAKIQRTFEGDLEGESSLEYLMAYPEGKPAAFVGHELFTGKFKGRAGSFVMQREGTAESDGVHERFFILPGTATGELAGLTGKGEWHSGHAESYPFSFEYEL